MRQHSINTLSMRHIRLSTNHRKYMKNYCYCSVHHRRYQCWTYQFEYKEFLHHFALNSRSRFVILPSIYRMELLNAILANITVSFDLLFIGKRFLFIVQEEPTQAKSQVELKNDPSLSATFVTIFNNYLLVLRLRTSTAMAA